MNRLFLSSILLLPAITFAATTPPPSAPVPPRKPASPDALRAFVANESQRLEQEMAGLIQQHAALSPTSSGWLDLRIDTRVIARWLCQQLLTPDTPSDTQAVAWLRYQDAITLAATLDSANLTAAPTAPQAAALLSIHKATFDLKPVASLAAIDAVLTPLRTPLLTALSGGAAADMRPPQSNGGTPNVAPPAPAAALPLTLDAMATRITQLSISVPLRQQLLAAVGAARQASPADGEKVTAMLRDAVALAGLLQTNFAVDPESRTAMEHQLGEAVALFSDPRVRQAGALRLAGLQQYKAISQRIGGLNLSPAVMQSLAPALGVARDRPDTAEKILTSIEQFAALDAQMAAKKPTPATDAASRAAEQQLKDFAAERSAFLSEAEQMGAGGAFAVTPDNLLDHILKLKSIDGLYDLLKNLSQTQAVLLALHPRPTGGVEKRLTQAVVHSGDADDAMRAAATQTLLDASALASAWTATQAELKQPIADEAMHVYTGKAWNDAAAALKATAAELAGQMAAGGPIDAARLAALGRVPSIFRAVRQVQLIQDHLGDLKALSRWADCDLDQKKMIAVLDTYQTEFSAVAAATLDGAGDDKSLRDVQEKYRGLLATLDAIAVAAPACAKMPADLSGLLCRLTIASDRTPREANVRNICWTTDLIGLLQSAVDTDTTQVQQLHDRLLQSLNRAVPAPPATP